jgi:hypothetical protein
MNGLNVLGQYHFERYAPLTGWSQITVRVLDLISNKWKTAFVRKFGSLIEEWDTKNTVVSAGLAQLALLAGDGTATAFGYMEVGTSSTAVSAGQTALQAAITDSGLARASATFSRTTTTVTNDTAQWTYTWTASGTKAVEEAGMFNASSSGTMLGRALTGTKTVTNGEQLTGTYTLKFANA